MRLAFFAFILGAYASAAIAQDDATIKYDKFKDETSVFAGPVAVPADGENIQIIPTARFSGPGLTKQPAALGLEFRSTAVGQPFNPGAGEMPAAIFMIDGKRFSSNIVNYKTSAVPTSQPSEESFFVPLSYDQVDRVFLATSAECEIAAAQMTFNEEDKLAIGKVIRLLPPPPTIAAPATVVPAAPAPVRPTVILAADPTTDTTPRPPRHMTPPYDGPGLRHALIGSKWSWENTGIVFREDGYVDHNEWTSSGLTVSWNAIDRRTVLLMITRGRDVNKLEVLNFSDDMTKMSGITFEGNPYGPGIKIR